MLVMLKLEDTSHVQGASTETKVSPEELKGTVNVLAAKVHKYQDVFYI